MKARRPGQPRASSAVWLARLHRDERGQMTFAVILSFLIVFIVAALAIDAGLWYWDHRTAQNQVEAASLAAVQALPGNRVQAVADAKEWLLQNGVDSDIVDAMEEGDGSDCGDMSLSAGEKGRAKILFDNGDTEAKVCLRRNSLVLLSALAAVTEARVSASAKARVVETTGPVALMAMNPGSCGGLDIAGNATVILEGGGASYTASSCDGSGENEALTVRGSNSSFEGDEHFVCGGYWDAGGLEGTVTTGVCGTPDPFESVPAPTVAPICSPLPIYNNPALNFTPGNSVPPGTYCSLRVEGNGTRVSLSGGVYVFTQGVEVSGSNTVLVTAGPSLIYMTCSSSPCNGAVPQPFRIRGGADDLLKLNITGSANPVHMEIAVFVDRTAGPSTCVEISGQGNVLINGNIYAISCSIRMAGQGDADFELNSTIVGNMLDFEGQAQYHVTWQTEVTLGPPEYILVE